jgi:hypothetical protein
VLTVFDRIFAATSLVLAWMCTLVWVENGVRALSAMSIVLSCLATYLIVLTDQPRLSRAASYVIAASALFLAAVAASRL